MKVLFLGGVFDDSHNEEIIGKTRTYVEYAANNFQKKIICGMQSLNVRLEIVSVPFLGAYPTAYSEMYFRGFKNMDKDKSGYEYCSFNNIFGIRNISRYYAAKKRLADFIEYKDEEKLIIVYSPHTPFVQAASWAKKKDPRIKICMVVPDLPQYMDLSDCQSFIYKVLKRIDIKKFYKENMYVDSYILLTDQMADALDVGDRPYKVVEGIYEAAKYKSSRKSLNKTIVYTGKLNFKFGAFDLVQAFNQIDNPQIRLVICGSGEAKAEIMKVAEIDSRIDFKGQVSSDIAHKCILDGDVLVNPRPNDSEYTKYSFPSKIIDYLATGNPVVAYKLDGMPDAYSNFIYYVPEHSVEALRDTLIKVLQTSADEIEVKTKSALNYIKENLSCKVVAETIINLNFGK